MKRILDRILTWQLYLQLHITGVHAHPPTAELSWSYIQCSHDLVSMLLMFPPKVMCSPKCCNMGIRLNGNTPTGISNSGMIYSLLGWLKCYVCEHPLAFSSTCTKGWISDTNTLCSTYTNRRHCVWTRITQKYGQTLIQRHLQLVPVEVSDKKFLLIQSYDLLLPAIYSLFAVNKQNTLLLWILVLVRHTDDPVAAGRVAQAIGK